jgi:type VI secretion system protein
MALILSIVRYKEQPPAEARAQRFTDAVVTIGRAPGNSLVLPDTENFISKEHCRITAQAGVYQIVDRSSNGTYINFAGEPLGRERRASLNDGDRLRIGDYDVLVQIVADQAALPDRAMPPPAAPPSFFEARPPSADPFGLGNLGLPGVETSGNGIAAAIDLDALFPSDPLGDLAPHNDAGFSATPPLDGAAAWGLGAPAPPPSPWPATAADHAAPERAFFQAPTPKPLAIPEDWHALAPAVPGAAAPPDAVPPAPPFDARTIGPGPSPTPAAAYDPAPRPAAPPPAPLAPPQPPALAPQRGGAADAGLLAAFLEGAGLPAQFFRGDAQPETTMRRLGAMMRQMVGGLSEILKTRALTKSELRLQNTQIGATNNNPLKLSPDVEEALALILGADRPGYMPGPRAVAEGFKDVKAHELALLAGMQAAVRALLSQFDPAQLTQRLDKSSLLASLVPGARKARYWEAYEAQYRQIAGDVSEDVRGVFGRAFTQAYEEQVKKLSGRG